MQIRTIAQHNWTAASRILQYKTEQGQSPVARSFNRVAAPLETVDLEFERVLEEREKYRSTMDSEEDEELNVDLFAKIVESEFRNRSVESNMDETLKYLIYLGVNTTDKLTALLSKHGAAAANMSNH